MKSKKDIFRDILISAQTNCVLKIKFSGKRNPVITAVDRVERNKIILKPTCLYGYEIEKRTVRLPQIENVILYRTKFDNPLFVKLRYIKKNLSAFRQGFRDSERSSVLKPG